ncbi:MAG TPA: sigma-70 family RNA polymerase sigma factor [Acidimicrobiales bacterium]|nr:sigma-70 family RNA polymerase sigma factor [Acidimicrobiales bacterium]
MERFRRSDNDDVLVRFEALFRENYSQLFQYVARRVPTAQIDDVVAASFVVAWRKFEKAPIHPTLPWLLRIASYEISNHRRSTRKWNNVISFEVSGEPPSSTSPDLDETEVVAALSRLSPADQEILRLIHWDALTRAEVAAALRLTPNATNVRYHRALRRLHDQMPPQSLRNGAVDTNRNVSSPPIKGALP